jgi:site-specific DNA recombinase
MLLKIAAYIRVSTEEQAQLVEGSLDNQKYRIVEFVKARGSENSDWGKIIEFYVDDGYSAKDTKRPAYQKMMEDIRKGRINLILVTDLSRLSRNILDFSNLLEYLDKWKSKFLSMKEQFDTSTPAGKMMIFNMINLAQFEREQTSERVALNAHARAMRGLLNGGQAVLGFERDPEKPGVLMVKDKEAKEVRTIFETFLEMGDRGKTIRRLHEIQIFAKGQSPGASGERDRKWDVNTLGNLLSQAAYIGYKEVNRRNKNVDPKDLKPWQRYQQVKASWPAIITEETFHRAQTLLREKGRLSVQRRGASENRLFYLSGFLSCKDCGAPLMGHTSHGKTSKHRYYVHTIYNRDHGCEIQRYRADELEDLVIDHLLNYGLNRAGYMSRIEKTLSSAAKEQKGGLSAEKKRALEQLKLIDAKISKVWQIQMQGSLNSDALKMVSEDLNQLALEKKSLQVYADTVEDTVAGYGNVEEQSEFISDRMDDLIKGWKKGIPSKKKLLLRRAIHSAIVSPKGIEISYFSANKDEEGKNRGLEVSKLLEISSKTNKQGNKPEFSKDLNEGNLKDSSSYRVKNGRGDRIRTYDPLVPNQMRYQTALRPDKARTI